MKTFKQHLKQKYHLSNYQIAQLTFLSKTVFSELSKVLIMGVIFHKQLPLYFFSLLIMLVLRCSTGGLHFYTYIGCLTTSIIYIWLGIILLPKILIPPNLKIILLIICIIICYHIGPIPSKYRPPFNDDFIKRCKKTISCFIFLYTLILYIMPKSTYLTVGFWIIILHSLQLTTAKYIGKGDLTGC